MLFGGPRWLKSSVCVAQLLGVTAIVLANLCVAHIMTSENEEAEEIMRQLEHEEERALLRVRVYFVIMI